MTAALDLRIRITMNPARPIATTASTAMMMPATAPPESRLPLDFAPVASWSYRRRTRRGRLG